MDGADTMIISTGTAAKMVGTGAPGELGAGLRDDCSKVGCSKDDGCAKDASAVCFRFAIGGAAGFASVALVGTGIAAKSSNGGSVETGTAGPVAEGLPNIERIIASAICAGDAAIFQGLTTPFAASGTCGAMGELNIRLIMFTNAGVAGAALATGGVNAAIRMA
jgi:hypothetical protein